MNWDRFLLYGDAPTQAFETLCNQLFERYLRRKYKSDLIKFRVINGSGGDGGIEAYGELRNGDLIAVQSKWFKDVMEDLQIRQIRSSIQTAKALRPNIRKYIICTPRDISSLKFGRGKKGEDKKPILDFEEQRVDDLISEMKTEFPDLELIWWFNQDLLTEIQQQDNEGVNKYWFDREILAIKHLQQQFDLHKVSWLSERYASELHGRGVIQNAIKALLFEEDYRQSLFNRLVSETRPFVNAKELVDKFVPTLPEGDAFANKLITISEELFTRISLINSIANDLLEGKELGTITQGSISIDRDIFDSLNSISPSNYQLNLKDRLINELGLVHACDLSALLTEIHSDAMQIGRLFLGDAGTGKTHALSNTVEVQLSIDCPAIIIRAKGCPSSSWKDVLASGLEIDGWSRNEMLSALETLAVRTDRKLATTLAEGKENPNVTKVVICVDGLEEDLLHWDDWHNRILETPVLARDYPQVRFVFTARGYFLNSSRLQSSNKFHIINVPREGDIPVEAIKDKYFSAEHFNINIEPPLVIRGIDSLFALRLFCEEYTGKTLKSGDEIIVAERKLLKKKIARLEEEFRALPTINLTTVRTPIKTSLSIISDRFYDVASITHSDLHRFLGESLSEYLSPQEIDTVIEFLQATGIITKSEIAGVNALDEAVVLYQISYQSIMEIIMADKVVKSIVENEITSLPDNLISEQTEVNMGGRGGAVILNQKIVENIVTSLFNDHEMMIGEDGFLANGLTSNEIEFLRFKALAKSTQDGSEKYKSEVKQHFLQDYKQRSEILAQLIVPSASKTDSNFGAEFLDEILNEPVTPFQRERIWLGWDRHEIYEQGETEDSYYWNDPHQAIAPNELVPALSPNDRHNDLPLIYGWSLATLKQNFRSQLRSRLYDWALSAPDEYLSLLQKLFDCNDPQIQEDLASITLGLASKLKDNGAILNLANWALENVFNNLVENRNIIVREGFRSIVERAYQFGLINESQVVKTRPAVTTENDLLPLDPSVLANPREEIYPIVHDLAWYVIERSFKDFLDYSDSENRPKLIPSRAFLKEVVTALGTDRIGPHAWAMAAAIAYMKSLGFDRIAGSGTTQASHGSKSEVFTLEEKYTWLAVHYIQGYLADRLPLKDSGELVSHYNQLEAIPNPAESAQDVTFAQSNGLAAIWIIPEPLVQEPLGELPFEEEVKAIVHAEPSLDFEKWIRVDADVFSDTLKGKPMLALYSYTSVHDSKKYVGSRLDLRACLIKKGQAEIIKSMIEQETNSLYFIESIDSMQAMPNTSTYSNPSDIVWMKWINEIENEVEYYDPISDQDEKLEYALTRVISNTDDGEKTLIIPSIKIRDLLKIVSLENGLLSNSDNEIMSVAFNNGRNPNYDTQEMVLIREHEFLEALSSYDLEIIWFADLLTNKNALNDAIKSDLHPQKSRKYFIQLVNGAFETTKFWDYRFSNSREHE